MVITANWPKRGRLLVIRLDASGDLLMCTPALQALSQAGYILSLLTSPAGALVGQRSSSVSQIFVFDAPWMKASAHTCSHSTLLVAEQLREHHFDGAIIMHSYSQSPLPAALLCHLADIPRQLAYCRENPYQLISDWLPEREPDTLVRHEVQRQLDLVCMVCPGSDTIAKSSEPARLADTRLQLTVTNEDLAAADEALLSAGLSKTQDFLLLHPGASAPSRRYPLHLLQIAVTQLKQITGLPLVLAGGEAERPELQTLRAAAGDACAGIVSSLDFGGLAALIGKARLLIANNSAPAHLAAAMQTPVVVPYALTNPQHTPWQVPSRVLFNPVPCAPCYRSQCPLLHHACLADIPPSRITAAVVDLLSETSVIEKTKQQAAHFEKMTRRCVKR